MMIMKRMILPLIAFFLLFLFSGCGNTAEYQVAATTLPVYMFTSALCDGTDITVGRLINENVSCLHDYTLQISQMRMLESAQAVVISGAGLEDFLGDLLSDKHILIDASVGTHIHASGHDHGEEHAGHHHDQDPHIWLSPENAGIMVENICAGLSGIYPQYAAVFAGNRDALQAKLDDLQSYGDQVLSRLSCRDLITFHDGFAYFADSFGLNILHAVEEESGSEASASELKTLIGLVTANHLPAVFTECNGSDAAARIISAETGVGVFALDMGMSDRSYFDAMYYNINTIKEALG
jgi:ABC-type Zn uptake system ZnuABC Zn-binding protein ZnuA